VVIVDDVYVFEDIVMVFYGVCGCYVVVVVCDEDVFEIGLVGVVEYMV